jgi:hypothetical protein
MPPSGKIRNMEEIMKDHLFFCICWSIMTEKRFLSNILTGFTSPKNALRLLAFEK